MRSIINYKGASVQLAVTRNKQNINCNRQLDNDAKSVPVMSNSSSYSLIDDDHIDDQETINVGNLIIDLESDLEKEKIENEQANAKPSTCSTTTTNVPSSTSSAASSSSFGVSNNNCNKASSSSTTSLGTNSGGKSNQKSLNKHANNSSSNNPSITNSSNSGTPNNNGRAATRTVFKSSADERGELKMRITRETKPGKSEHKIVASPNQKSPISSSNNTTTSHANNCEDTNTNDTMTKPSQSSSSISSTKECGTSTSVGTITEPECLGPCEPGTSVTLEGIVWQETDGGILVVNVTWRGKTYVGALLDCTRHDWAPPRLCDSPASDIDSKTHKGVRTKRIVTRSNGIGLDEKNLLQTTGKLRNGKGRRILPSNDPASSCSKRQRDSDKSTENISAQAEVNAPLATGVSSVTNSENACVPMSIDTMISATTTTTTTNNQESTVSSNISMDKAGPNSPMLIGCSEPNCSKKYRNMNGLLYHQTHAHGTENESNNTQDDNCSSSSKDKVKTTNKNESSKDQKDSNNETSHRQSPSLKVERKETSSTDVKQFQVQHPQSQPQLQPQLQPQQDVKRTPSPQLSMRPSNKMINEPIPNNNNNATLNQELPRPPIIKNLDPERRHSSGYSVPPNIGDPGHRSPGAPRHLLEAGHGTSSNHSTSKSSSSSLKQSNLAPLPATTEEGMKPSGTSTGPPPAPHQANCYFNSAFLANTFTPYGLPPYFPRHMYDQIAPPTPTSNAAFLSRFMSNMRVPPPPESPSRLLSPSIPKNIPFPPFKVEPGPMPPVPPPSSMPNPTLPNISPLTNTPLASGSPHLRMPSQMDSMLPPTSQPPFLPPAGLNPALGLPGAVNPLGHVGGPQVPSLVDDQLAKQFPRRFN